MTGAALAGNGIEPGDRVAIQLQNVPEYAVGILAAWRAGTQHHRHHRAPCRQLAGAGADGPARPASWLSSLAGRPES
jgi:hypothetical protein